MTKFKLLTILFSTMTSRRESSNIGLTPEGMKKVSTPVKPVETVRTLHMLGPNSVKSMKENAQIKQPKSSHQFDACLSKDTLCKTGGPTVEPIGRPIPILQPIRRSLSTVKPIWTPIPMVQHERAELAMCSVWKPIPARQPMRRSESLPVRIPEQITQPIRILEPVTKPMRKLESNVQPIRKLEASVHPIRKRESTTKSLKSSKTTESNGQFDSYSRQTRNSESPFQPIRRSESTVQTIKDFMDLRRCLPSLLRHVRRCTIGWSAPLHLRRLKQT